MACKQSCGAGHAPTGGAGTWQKTHAGVRFGHVETLYGFLARQKGYSHASAPSGPGKQQSLRFPARRRPVQAGPHPPAPQSQRACAGADECKPIAKSVRPKSRSVSQTMPIIPASVSPLRPISARPAPDDCKPLHLVASGVSAPKASTPSSRPRRFGAESVHVERSSARCAVPALRSLLHPRGDGRTRGCRRPGAYGSTSLASRLSAAAGGGRAVAPPLLYRVVGAYQKRSTAA